MNANEISSKASVRLRRIKIVSRIVRYFFLALLASMIGQLCFHLMLPLFHTETRYSYSIRGLLIIFPVIALTGFWYGKLAQLFHFYERGLIFHPATIRCIKILGYFCVINWIFIFAHKWLEHSAVHHPPPLPGVVVVESTLNFGFFTFSFAGINLGMLLAGMVIVVIAWIMDEGRKIQEEQELTV